MARKRSLVIPAAVVLGMFLITLGLDVTITQAQTTYRLQTSTMGAAGARSASSNYASKATMAQPTPIGVGTAGDNALYAGFWSKYWSAASVEGDDSPDAIVDRLYQNFPNPFTSSTSIAFSVSSEKPVEIAVFNVEGRRVRTVTSESRSPGRHVATWNGTDDRGRRVSPGVYFYRIEAGGYTSVKKMLVLN
jgi:hypothetical protein